ncbi:MAG: DNA polymerase III subunit gamma/tau [Bacilli bacterium]
MSYKALYRTYRPLSFQEVAGQQHIVKTLENALKSGKIAHAYLFTGPRGTGKTTMAKLFAKALNCETGVGNQCNQCSNCLGVNDGSHPDVLEIDAASNSGVDDIRNLIENVKYSPIKGRYKVYIIDEVHMMSSSAFNALLKTLEEPPANVIFILATTEAHKVLPTILSRCQRYDFTKVSDTDIYGRIIDILTAEKIQYDKRAVDIIISLADGGVRDALSMLDQVLAFSNDKLLEKDVLQLFGLASTAEKIALLEAANERDIKTLLTKSQAFIEHGIDIKRLTLDLLNILKDLLIFGNTHDEKLLLVLNPEDVLQLGKKISESKARAMIDVLLLAQAEFRNVANIRSLFEVVLLKLAALNDKEELKIEQKEEPQEETITRKLVTTTTPTGRPIPISAGEIHVRPHELPFNQPKVEPDPEKTEEKQIKEPVNPAPKSIQEKDDVLDKLKSGNIPKLETEGEKISIDDESLIGIMCLGNRDEKLHLSREWRRLERLLIDDKIGPYAAILKDGIPYILSEGVLVLVYDFVSIADQVNIIENQRIFQKIVEKLLGRQVIVYGLNGKDRNRVQKKFLDLSQLGRLPKRKEVIIEIAGSEKL